jgi:OFA family oxalate/formate antiporter-like MFS transporter
MSMNAPGSGVRTNRLRIAVAAVFMDMAFGTIQAWSVFRNPLMESFGWTMSEVTLAFTLHYAAVGVAAVLGGLWMVRAGPRTAGLLAGVLYGSGFLLASGSADRLWVLYLSFGLVGGLGRGMGAIVAVTTVVRWYPDRRGLVSGLSGIGFGTGALVAAPLAARVIPAVGVLATFALLGACCLILVVVTALFMSDPPPGFEPPGWRLAENPRHHRSSRNYTLFEALKTWQAYILCSLAFLNAVAGLGLVSQAAPMAEEMTRVDSFAAGGMVGVVAAAYAVGRFSWAWFSDILGRRWTFVVLYLIQTAVFLSLPSVQAFSAFTILLVFALLCYGGGIGVMPAFLADYFGPDNVGALFGLMIVAQCVGAAVGPMLFAFVRELTGAYALTLWILAGLMAFGGALSFSLRPPEGGILTMLSRLPESTEGA